MDDILKNKHQELQSTQKAWDSVAEGFDDFVTPLNLPLAEDPLNLAGLESKMEFIDIAAGTGALSIPAARRGAKVTAIDISPVMLQRLQLRVRNEGLTGVNVQVMDGCNLSFPDNRFDIAASQNGVSLFPDLQQGLSEMVRVTRPGGKVMVIAFGAPENAEFITFFMNAVQQLVPGFSGLPDDPPPLPFQLADPEQFRKHLSGAGLRNISISPFRWIHNAHSGSQLWNIVTNSNPIGQMVVSELSENQKTLIRQKLDEMLHERSGNRSAAQLTADLNIGIGVK